MHIVMKYSYLVMHDGSTQENYFATLNITQHNILSHGFVQHLQPRATEYQVTRRRTENCIV